MGRRQTGNEFSFRDWMGAAGAIGSINNSMIKSENQGMKREDREREKSLMGATDAGLTAVNQGMTLDNTQKYLQGDSVPATQNIVDEINEPGAEVTMRTNKFTPAIGAAGFQNAMKLNIGSMDAMSDKKSADFQRKFSTMSLEELSNLDTSTLGKDAFAARIAQGKVLAKHGETEDNKLAAYTKRNATAQKQYDMFSNGIMEAENAFTKGEKGVSRDIVLNLINNVNNTPYKATADGDGIRMHMTYEGEDKKDEKVLSVSDALAELKKISKVNFTEAFHKNADFARDLNKKSLEKPILMTNGKEIVQVIATSDPQSSGFTYEAYNQNGKIGDITDIKELRANGYYNYSPKTAKGSAKTKLDQGKNFDAIAKRIKGIAESLAENNPRFKTNEVGEILDASTGQKAGIAPYAIAVHNMLQTGQISPEEARDYAVAMGITESDLQLAASGGKPVTPVEEKKEGIFNSLMGKITETLSEKNQPAIAPPKKVERSQFDRSLDRYVQPMSSEEEARQREAYIKSQDQQYPRGMVRLVGPDELDGNKKLALRKR